MNPIPVRMLNEFAYCPRLFHLMHVERRWENNAYTEEGRAVHRRVDRIEHLLPEPEDRPPPPERDDGDEPPELSRSVPLDSEILGLSGKLDLVSTAENEAVPVETKRGQAPETPERCWEPERIQLMAQGLLLRESGYYCDHGILYFAGSRTRVPVPFTPELEARTLFLLQQAIRAADSSDLPRPLEDSPKCNGCSLAGICLPDETLALQEIPPDTTAPQVRRLYPVRDNAVPFYIQTQGARVGKKGKIITVKFKKEEIGRARLKDISQLVLCGNIMVTAQTIHLLCEAGIPIVHLSMGHWFYGLTSGITVRNGFNRNAQYKIAECPNAVLRFSQEIVMAKATNQRVMLRRNAGGTLSCVLDEMARKIKKIETARDLGQLLGYEGTIAATYFSHFSAMLKGEPLLHEWNFKHRNRRPPRDPVNAMLSFAYTCLAKECSVALLAEGLDPYWGLYHQVRHGRPALALDLMEEFRPLVADSAVLTAINTGMLAPRNFVCSSTGCLMKPAARKALLRAYEARLDQTVTHPLFQYRCSWRSIIRMQARLLGRWFRKDIPAYTAMITR